MIIYHATAAESRKLSHIDNCLRNYLKLPLDRCLDFGVDHVSSYGTGPFTPEEQIQIARVTPIIGLFRAALVVRNTDLGKMTVDVSLQEEKWKTLPFLFEEIQPLIRKAYPNDDTIFKYLYLLDKNLFEKGSNQAKITFLDGWIDRITSKTLIPNVLTIVTDWVDDYRGNVGVKVIKKDDITEDRDDIYDLRDQLFDALRKNYGELYTENSKDIRPILRKFNTNLLKKNASDSSKLKVNEFELSLENGLVATADYEAITPKSVIVADSRKNDFESIIFLSILAPNGIPEFAFTIPKLTMVNINAPVIGPKYAKKINAKATDPLSKGILKVTVKHN